MLGKSQKEFADSLEKELGLSPASYKAYELGTRVVTEELATHLMILHGVDPVSIMEQRGEPKALDGKPYTVASERLIVERERGYSTDAMTRLLTLLGDRHLIVLLAARRKGKFTHAAYIFEIAIQKAIRDLDLSEEISKLLSGKEEFRAWRGVKMGMIGAPYRMPSEPFIPRGKEYEEALKSLLTDGDRRTAKRK